MTETQDLMSTEIKELSNYYFAFLAVNPYDKQLKYIGEIKATVNSDYYLCSFYTDHELDDLKFEKLIHISELTTYLLFPTREDLIKNMKNHYFW